MSPLCDGVYLPWFGRKKSWHGTAVRTALFKLDTTDNCSTKAAAAVVLSYSSTLRCDFIVAREPLNPAAFRANRPFCLCPSLPLSAWLCLSLSIQRPQMPARRGPRARWPLSWKRRARRGIKSWSEASPRSVTRDAIVFSRCNGFTSLRSKFAWGQAFSESGQLIDRTDSYASGFVWTCIGSVPSPTMCCYTVLAETLSH